MNETIQLLKSHKSIRQFEQGYKISDQDLQEILTAAQSAATWMNGQFYSIIVVRDEGKREALQALKPSMPFIKECSELLVFVADLQRTKVAAEMHATTYHATGIEPVLVGTVDTSLAAQNAIIAAESLGLGTVVIGMIRPESVKASEILGLPEYTAPLFLVAIGKPTEEALEKTLVKPRFSQEVVVHYDTYQPTTVQQIQEYEEELTKFAGKRQQTTWSEKFAAFFGKEPQQNSTELMKKHKLL